LHWVKGETGAAGPRPDGGHVTTNIDTDEDGDRGPVFRFPSADDPRPRTRRLFGMSLYASVLGLLGVAVAVRGLMAILAGSAPGWYEPALAGTGLLCVALVVAAFLSIHRWILPWLLLLSAALPLAATITYAATRH
jgi:hypothetical protein